MLETVGLKIAVFLLYNIVLQCTQLKVHVSDKVESKNETILLMSLFECQIPGNLDGVALTTLLFKILIKWPLYSGAWNDNIVINNCFVVLVMSRMMFFHESVNIVQWKVFHWLIADEWVSFSLFLVKSAYWLFKNKTKKCSKVNLRPSSNCVLTRVISFFFVAHRNLQR